jgi:hypothetical protein
MWVAVVTNRKPELGGGIKGLVLHQVVGHVGGDLGEMPASAALGDEALL